MGSDRNHVVQREIPRRLAEALSVPRSRLSVAIGPPFPKDKHKSLDLLVSVGGRKFAVEWKASANAADIGMAVRSLADYVRQSRGKVIPVAVAPYIGPVAQDLCDQAGVSWLDLSGNAHLRAPGLHINIQGKPNRFKRPGRPRTVFAPKSSRIARCLLEEPEQALSQRELSKAAGLDEGFTSRIVRHLESQHLITRNSDGAIRVIEPQALLTAWREVYDFFRHRIIRGHIAARSGDEIVQRLSSRLSQDGLEHAATGLSGAWLINHFAGFRLVTFYVADMPSVESLQSLGFRHEKRGENVWLVIPNDAGVFQGAAKREGIRCAHPVQVYLDLKDQPERSAEAAEALRPTLFGTKKHG